MAKNDNLADYLADIADAIRAKKGTEEPINAQDFATEIASIEGGSRVQLVPYLRRIGKGYLDTGVQGANDKIKITVRYSFNTFASGYWNLIRAYENESTNATRILFSSNKTVLANVNSLAYASITQTVVMYADCIYTTSAYLNGNNITLLNNGVTNVKTRTTGTALGDKTLILFSQNEDVVDVNIYSLKIENGGALVRNYVPCYHGEEFGLFDLVERRFYGNQGEGTFTGELITTE